MPITIGSNINSLFALRQLGSQSRELLTTTERLSSGLRINSAKDDPAGLSLSSKLSTDVKIARQGIRNVNDVVSVLNVAESAIDSLVQIVSRQQELATQAANGVYTTAQRTALDTEADALTAEYNRIVESTTFNGVNLFDGTFATIGVQAGSSHFTVDGANLNISVTTGDGTFAAATTLATGSNPKSVTSADVNGDGKLDLVSADGDSNQLSVFLGNGNGTFQSATTLATGIGPSAVISADFNGDGEVDLVSADAIAEELNVFLGNGDGTFQAATTIATSAPWSFASADFNRDGRIDLVTADRASGQLNVFIGNGDGTFAAATTLAVGALPNSIITADFDGDGNADIVSSDISLGRSVFLGNGDGTFATAPVVNPGTTAYAITSNDLNGDGRLDLITADTNHNILSFFLGNGDGTFQSVTTLATGSDPSYVFSGDVNGDGKIDLVSADYSSDQLSVFIGNGDGTFQTATALTTGTNPQSITSGDVNGDGVLDLVSADGASDRLSIFIQDTTTSSSPLATAVDLTTEEDARSAISYLSQVSDTLQSARSTVGASLSRLDVTINNLTSAASLFEEANSKIVDLDYAEEVANLIRLQVKQQATTALLAQANLQPQLVLKLLES